MVLCQSEDRFDDLIELDPDTAQITRYSRRANPSVASRCIRGHFAVIAGCTLFLYRGEDGELHFRIDDLDFPLLEDTCVEFKRGEPNKLRVVRNGIALFAWEYEAPVSDPPLSLDPTPFVEEEHFDFGLFLHNVTNDPVRRNGIYRC